MADQILRTIVTFLELDLQRVRLKPALKQLSPGCQAQPETQRQAPPVRLSRVTHPEVGFYRALYDAVGRPHAWISRKRLSDQDLRTLITHPSIAIHVLREADRPLGFFELNLTDLPRVELTFLGLVPEATGLGHGRSLLHAAISAARAKGARKMHLQTCTLDHPHALPLYRKVGFEPFKMKSIELAVPEEDLPCLHGLQRTGS